LRSPSQAYDVVIREDSVEAYQAYLVLFGNQPTGPRVRGMLERRQLMIAWYNAVLINTPASFQLFLANYAGSDYAATAERLLQRARERSFAAVTAGPTCPCPAVTPAPPREKKASKKEKKEKPKKEASRPKSTKQGKKFVSDAEVGNDRPRPAGGGAPVASGGGGIPISIGIGFGGGGRIGRPSGGYGGGGGGGHSSSGHRR
jgi:hypothetical protein